MANNIKVLREREGWSQELLGARVGVHFNTIGNWEDGTSEPRASQIAAMADLFGVSVETVMGLADLPVAG